MTKLDLRKQFKHLYQPSAKAPVVVEVPEFQFLMVDGQGDPNTSAEFQAAVEALYGMSYTLKFAAKLGPLQVDYPVMALEGLWWTEPPITDLRAFGRTDRGAWHWTLLIMQPEIITAEMLVEAREKVRKKRESPALEQVRLERFREGTAVQTHAYRAICGGAADAAEAARVRRGAGLCTAGEAPRDLPVGPAAGGAGEDEDRAAASGGEGVGGRIDSRRFPPLTPPLAPRPFEPSALSLAVPPDCPRSPLAAPPRPSAGPPLPSEPAP